MLSPLSSGKFNRAILQSGAPQAQWGTVTKTEAVRRATELAKAFNCKTPSITATNGNCVIPMAIVW
jgi:carboxylesterase type B